jgi:hypothetical protein
LPPVGDLFGTPIKLKLSLDSLPSLRQDQGTWFLAMPLLG